MRHAGCPELRGRECALPRLGARHPAGPDDQPLERTTTMESNSGMLLWMWLIGAPLILAIIDRMRT